MVKKLENKEVLCHSIVVIRTNDYSIILHNQGLPKLRMMTIYGV